VTGKQKFWAALLVLSCLAFGVLAVASVAVIAVARNVDWGQMGVVLGGGSLPLGEPAPDLRLRDLDGGQVRLADLRGRPVLVEFWATWCPPCVEALPHIQEIHDRYAERGLAVLAVTTDQDEAEVRAFLKSEGYTFPVLWGDYQAQRDYMAFGIPRTCLVDRAGVLRYQSRGYSLKAMEELEERVRQLVEEVPEAVGEGPEA